MNEKVLALKSRLSSDIFLEGVRNLIQSWGATPKDISEVRRSNGGCTVSCAMLGGGELQFLMEPENPYVLVRIFGEADFVDDIVARAADDVWMRDEILLQLTRTDPPDSSLLVTVALLSDALDEQSVEIFLRALEAKDLKTRKQAVVAVSFVPALVFAPALRVLLASERESSVRALAENVLVMCES